MFGVIAGFGLGTTATKYVAQLRISDPSRAGRIIGLSIQIALFTGFSMAIVLFFGANWLAVGSLNAPHLDRLLKIASLTLLFNAVKRCYKLGL